MNQFGDSQQTMEEELPKLRAVLDTNVLVAAAYARSSASRTIAEASLAGQIAVIVSSQVLREYQYILGRAIRRARYQNRLETLVNQAEIVEPESTPRVVMADADDDKFLALAIAGSAEFLVTNDQHLLALDPYHDVRIVRPNRFVQVMASGGREEVP